MNRSSRALLWTAALPLALGGCALDRAERRAAVGLPALRGQSPDEPAPAAFVPLPEAAAACPPCTADVERGRPNAVVDGLGWLFGLPRRALLWNRKVENHRIGPETESAVAEYLSEQGLSDVKVRLNQYRPGAEFVRLCRNRTIHPLLRGTFGTVHWLGYTLFPGRIWGGDRYDPFTNTLSVYSDVPAIALQEAAYAADVHRRPRPGVYAALQDVPGVNIWHETLAYDETLRHLGERRGLAEVQAARQVLAPRMGLSAGNALGQYLSFEAVPIFPLAGALAGHWAVRTHPAP